MTYFKNTNAQKKRQHALKLNSNHLLFLICKSVSHCYSWSTSKEFKNQFSYRFFSLNLSVYMIVEKGHFHFAKKYWQGGARPPWCPLFRRPCVMNCCTQLYCNVFQVVMVKDFKDNRQFFIIRIRSFILSRE